MLCASVDLGVATKGKELMARVTFGWGEEDDGLSVILLGGVWMGANLKNAGTKGGEDEEEKSLSSQGFNFIFI